MRAEQGRGRSGAEVSIDAGRIRLKIWGPRFDEFVVLDVESAAIVLRQLTAAIQEVAKLA